MRRCNTLIVRLARVIRLTESATTHSFAEHRSYHPPQLSVHSSQAATRRYDGPVSRPLLLFDDIDVLEKPEHGV